MTVMIRIPEARREVILKSMEMGAMGILLPQTETIEQAKTLVQCSTYAPQGRGRGKKPRAQNYLQQQKMSQVTVPPEVLKAFCVEAFEALHVPVSDAEIAASNLVESETSAMMSRAVRQTRLFDGTLS